MKKGLQYRYGLMTVTLIVLVAVTLSTFLQFQYRSGFNSFVDKSHLSTEQYLNDQIQQRGLALITVLAENITNALYSMDMESLLFSLTAIKSSEDVISAQVYDTEGMIIHDGDQLIPSYGKYILDSEVLSAINIKNETTVFQQASKLMVAKSIWIGETPLGGVQLWISLDSINAKLDDLAKQEQQLYSDTLKSFYLIAFNTTLVLMLMGIIISFFLSRRILQPIEAVASVANDVGKNDFTKKLEYKNEDEIGELVQSFNNMTDQLKEEKSRREQTEEKLRQQALYDTVTSLPNRALVLDRLKHSIEHSVRDHNKIALIFIDLDDFKKVNDTLGHDVGDQLLICSAHRLQSAVRPSDTVARLGGDEFVVLITGLADTDGVSSVVESLLKQFRKPFKIDGRSMLLTASIGISIFPDDGSSEATLLRKADAAMYHSKNSGRNTYSFYTDQMNEQVSRRLLIEEQMQIGLENHEFSVVYQPKVCLSDYQVSGVEALLRWNNQALGPISPVEFIPIAEQTGIISELGEMVLNQALSDLKRWKQFNENFIVSVNLSPRQFRDSSLTSKISTLLSNHGHSGSSLELEITEGVLLSGHVHVDRTLEEIRKLGIRISMDDFGTGYSALSYLRKYPFDVIKIDQSFVRDIETDPEDCALIEATIAMAHALNLRVVAEGVETTAQLEFLEGINCDCLQGYYFSKPVSAEIIEEKFLREPLTVNAFTN
ncbi:MAG: EAL domain-containing protein [Neptuniibacter sp.]